MLNKERRAGDRHDCNGDYFFSPDSRNQKYSCLLKNVSVTGACILTEFPLKNDDQITLHVCLGKDIELKSSVVWKKNDLYGLLFELETPEAFDNISYLINNRPV
ncbi:MAG TPA: PilZ domain-containing protein [Spirochaetota bacterium]|nr:PilZ domain-containing protein [Spirochaetota bacterium]